MPDDVKEQLEKVRSVLQARGYDTGDVFPFSAPDGGGWGFGWSSPNYSEGLIWEGYFNVEIPRAY